MTAAPEPPVPPRAIAIVGAGAIGGLLGIHLAQLPGVTVSLVARGRALERIRAGGWTLTSGATTLRATVQATDDAGTLGPQDLVVIAVKAHALPAALPAITPLLGPDTIVLPAMNGVPWWFGHGVAALGAAPIAAVDPGGAIAAAIPYRAVVGCVVHASAAVPEPGVVRHQGGRKLIVGEPAGGISARARGVAGLLSAAGFEPTLSDDVRRDVWYKLWGNLTMNPVSAITGATTDRILDDPLVRDFCSAAMREVAAVGARIGCPIDSRPEERQALTRKLGAFKTSMLQDAEAGRPLELDAIVAAVHEIGRRLDEPTPNIDTLLGLTRLFARVRGLYPDA